MKIVKIIVLILSILNTIHATEFHIEQDNDIMNSDALTLDDLLQPIKNDIVYGDSNAPIVIVECSSLSCPHCSKFHSEMWPKIKKNLIDRKRVRYIYRNIPTNASSVYATLLLNTIDHNIRIRIIDALFKSQVTWAFSKEYKSKILNIARLSGYAGATADDAIYSRGSKNTIIQWTYKINNTMQLDGTPVFFINGKKYSGAMTYKNILKVLKEQSLY